MNRMPLKRATADSGSEALQNVDIKVIVVEPTKIEKARVSTSDSQRPLKRAKPDPDEVTDFT